MLLPRCWVVEGTFAWLNRSHRLAKNIEATIASSVTWLYIASVKLMCRLDYAQALMELSADVGPTR